MTSRWRWAFTVGALALSFALVMFSALAVNLSLVRLSDGLGLVQHTDDVLLQAAVIEGDLIEAESAERGYLLTGDEDYSGAFVGLRAAIDVQTAALLKLVADNPYQRERLEQIRPMLADRMAELSHVITLGPAHLQDALAAVSAAKERNLTALIRERFGDFREVETRLLEQRQARAAQDITRSAILAAVTTILALLSASLGLFLFQRARARHREQALRTELLHISRLNTMGQMASMLAHELNQPLTATINYLRAMLRMAEATQPANPGTMVEILQRSNAQMVRAREIVQRLRSFIEKGEPATTTEEVAPMLDEAVALLGMRRDGLTMSCEVAPGVPAVLVDKIQVQQVLINLMRNAVEAMEKCERRELQLSAAVSGDDAVCISVSDTGPGLPRTVAEQLFQPFVTTKSNGMGVGLSICQTIVRANGGRIWVEPNPEGGTIFRFTLPVAPPAQAIS